MTAEMLEESFMAEAYIVAAARTAGGRRGGRLSGWHPADLAAQVIDALVDRTNADAALVDDVIMGCVLQAGEQSGCIGRMAVLKPWRGRGLGSAILEALVGAARARGDQEVVLSAQTHALEFYRLHGFEPRGEVYLEAGIEHQEMRCSLRS